MYACTYVFMYMYMYIYIHTHIYESICRYIDAARSDVECSCRRSRTTSLWHCTRRHVWTTSLSGSFTTSSL